MGATRTSSATIHHTDCGMLTFTDDEFKAGIQNSPVVPTRDAVRGFVFDVATGRLREVV